MQIGGVIKRNKKLEGLGGMIRRSKKPHPSVWLNLLYVPALVLFVVFILYPFVKGIQVSFTNWDGYSQTFSWIGLDNYRRMLDDPNIGTVIQNTLIYGICSTLFQNIIGLAYALLLDKSIKGRGIVRTIVYLPVIISPLIMGYIWYFFFQLQGGALNDIVQLFGEQPVNFLGDPKWNVWIITFVNTYQYVGIAMVIYMAGLQSISREYYEAAELDGASGWQRFWHITLPLLMPAITVNIVLNLIGGLKLFDVIMALTKGGPGYASQSISTMMYKLYFASQDAGYAVALGNLMFVLISVFSLLALYFLRRREVV